MKTEETKQIFPSPVVWHFAVGISLDGDMYASSEGFEFLISRLAATNPKEFTPAKVEDLTATLKNLTSIGVEQPKRKGKCGRPPKEKNKTSEQTETEKMAQQSEQKQEQPVRKSEQPNQPEQKLEQPRLQTQNTSPQTTQRSKVIKGQGVSTPVNFDAVRNQIS